MFESPYRETLCTRCAHCEVCKFSDELFNLEEQVGGIPANKAFSIRVTCGCYKNDVPTPRKLEFADNPAT